MTRALDTFFSDYTPQTPFDEFAYGDGESYETYPYDVPDDGPDRMVFERLLDIQADPRLTPIQMIVEMNKYLGLSPFSDHSVRVLQSVLWEEVGRRQLEDEDVVDAESEDVYLLE